MATPPSLPEDFAPDVAAARRVIEGAVREGRTWLDPIEVTRLLAAYAIPIAPAVLARDADEAAAVAAPVPGRRRDGRRQDPVARHRAQVGRRRRAAEPDQRTGGARGDRRHPRSGARARARRPHHRRHRPSDDPAPEGARADRRHRRRSDLRPGHRLRPRRHRGRGDQRQGAGAAAARPEARARADRAHPRRRACSRPIATCRPPTRAPSRSSWSSSRNSRPTFPRSASSISIPFWPTSTGVIAVDARVAVAPVDSAGRGALGHPRFAIRPYPKEWERHATLRDGTAIFVRPVRPEDEPLYRTVLRRGDRARICGCASSPR